MAKKSKRDETTVGENLIGFLIWAVVIGGFIWYGQSGRETATKTRTTPTSTPYVFRVPEDCNTGRMRSDEQHEDCSRYYAGGELVLELTIEADFELMETREAQAIQELNRLEAIEVATAHAGEATEWAKERATLEADGILEPVNSTTSCAYVNRESNLRAGPGTNYQVLAVASTGTCLSIYGTNNGWYAFMDADRFGGGALVWISSELVTGAPSNLQIAYPNIAPASSAPLPTHTLIPTPVPQNNIVQPSPSCPDGCTSQQPGCNIKGNVGYDSGERIYHMPGQEYYSVTNINPDYGERWFCTEAEAQAAGWRRSYR